jgi:hypothetical protein
MNQDFTNEVGLLFREHLKRNNQMIGTEEMLKSSKFLIYMCNRLFEEMVVRVAELDKEHSSLLSYEKSAAITREILKAIDLCLSENQV